MTGPVTRRGRGNLIREAEKDLSNLKDQLINNEVIDFAVNLRGTLSTISDRYTSDAIVDLIPDITNVLNKLDSLISTNNDLKENLSQLFEENKLLSKHLENEKNNRKESFEDSLCYEAKTEEELRILKLRIENLEVTQNKLREELKNKDAIIYLLQSEHNDLHILEKNTSSLLPSLPLENNSNFITPKKSVKPCKITDSNTVNVNNRYATLAVDHSPPSSSGGHEVQVLAQVHRSASPPPPSIKVRTQPTLNSVVGATKRKRIVVLSDSQGKEFGKYLRELQEDYDVFVYAKPGAKLKHVVRDGFNMVRDFGEEDFIILLAGTNDLHPREPAQLTVAQGIHLLLSWKLKTNILFNSVPYRYDHPSRNNNIFFTNCTLSKTIKDYKGGLNIHYEDVNAVLTRSDFTRHGLHYSQRGKQRLAGFFTRFIRQTNRLSPILVPSDVSSRQVCEGEKCVPRADTTASENAFCDITSLIEPYPDLSLRTLPQFSSPVPSAWPTPVSTPLLLGSPSTNNFSPLPSVEAVSVTSQMSDSSFLGEDV